MLAGEDENNPVFSQRQVVAGGLVILAMLVAAALWFITVNSVRIKELNYRLKSSTDQSKSVRNSALVSRFRLLRSGEADNYNPAAYAREGRVMQILAGSAYLNVADDLSIGERVAKLTMDLFDSISGAPAFRHEKNTMEYKLMEKAFYHEITRSYKEAVSQYDRIILESAKKNHPDNRHYVLLHRGFCLALTGNRKAAVEDLRTVLQEAKDEESVNTARQLLSMLESIDGAIQRANAMPVSTQKGMTYYELTAYDQAIGTFRQLPDIEGRPEAVFYLARSLEEKGNAAEAVEYYRKLIGNAPDSVWAKKANRRLYALGAYYAAGKEYRQESKTNIEKGLVKDQELLAESRLFQKVSDDIDAGEKIVVAKLVATPEKPAAPAIAPPPEPKVAEVPAAPLPQPKPQSPNVERPAQKSVVQLPAHDWEKLEKLSRAGKIRYLGQQKQLEQILLENGSQFKGLLISESKDTLSLFTMIGRVVIEKSEIESRTRVSP